MGYTQYWNTIKRTNESGYKKALIEIRKVLELKKDILAGSDGTGDPDFKTDIYINGKHDDSHETFFLPDTLKQIKKSDFCKTNRKPYDVVVVACLAILKKHLGKDLLLCTDGTAKDWEEGCNLASKVLQKNIRNPFEKQSVDFIKKE